MARTQRGAELIEFALVFPILLVVVAGIIDFGLLFQRYEIMTNAAREGARVGVLPGYLPTNPDGTVNVANVQARVNEYLTTSGFRGAPSVGVATVPLAGAGIAANAVRVTVSLPYTFFFLGPISRLTGGSVGTVTLTATSTMRLEVPGS